MVWNVKHQPCLGHTVILNIIISIYVLDSSNYQLKRQLLRSSLRGCLNQRSCSWIITTSEPRLASICIYWLTEVSLQSHSIRDGSAHMMLSALSWKHQKKKTLSSNHFFTRRPGFGLMLILFNGEKEQNPVTLVQSYRWAAEERLTTSAGCLFEAERCCRAAHEQPCNHLLMKAGEFQWTISATRVSNKTATLLGYCVVSSKIENWGVKVFNGQLYCIFI